MWLKLVGRNLWGEICGEKPDDEIGKKINKKQYE